MAMGATMRKYANPHENSDETPGGDSFLDIVANMVGILILLVVVVGVRAGQQVLEPIEKQPELKTAELKKSLQSKARIIKASYNKGLKLASQLGITQGEIELRNESREELAIYLETLKAEIKQERESLNANDRRTYELGNQIAQLELAIEELSSEHLALTSNDQETETEAIYFDPTPIIRSEVEDQIMLRLRDGQVTYLPMDELYGEISRGRAALRNQLSRQMGSEAMIQMDYGPNEGFLIHVIFKIQTVSNGGSVYRQSSVVVARLEEQGVARSDSIDSFLEPGTPLTTRLSQIDPKQTVVTLITYPDSYGELPEVEKRLRENGYQVAKALQRADEPIEFSPQGRSTMLQ